MSRFGIPFRLSKSFSLSSAKVQENSLDVFAEAAKPIVQGPSVKSFGFSESTVHSSNLANKFADLYRTLVGKEAGDRLEKTLTTVLEQSKDDTILLSLLNCLYSAFNTFSGAHTKEEFKSFSGGVHHLEKLITDEWVKKTGINQVIVAIVIPKLLKNDKITLHLVDTIKSSPEWLDRTTALYLLNLIGAHSRLQKIDVLVTCINYLLREKGKTVKKFNLLEAQSFL